jgi:hypothetical protein
MLKNIHRYTYVHSYTQPNGYNHGHTHTHTNTHTHTHTHNYTYTPIYTYTHVHYFTYTHIPSSCTELECYRDSRTGIQTKPTVRHTIEFCNHHNTSGEAACGLLYLDISPSLSLSLSLSWPLPTQAHMHSHTQKYTHAIKTTKQQNTKHTHTRVPQRKINPTQS